MFLKFAAASVYLLAMAEADIIIPDVILPDQLETASETKSDSLPGFEGKPYEEIKLMKDDENAEKTTISCCYFNDP